MFSCIENGPYEMSKAYNDVIKVIFNDSAAEIINKQNSRNSVFNLGFNYNLTLGDVLFNKCIYFNLSLSGMYLVFSLGLNDSFTC